MGYTFSMEPLRKPDISRLTRPVPWRPAPQIGDAHYRMPKAALRALILAAERPRAT
jgi:hypothetical protein